MKILTDDFREIVSELPSEPHLALIEISERINIWAEKPEKTTDEESIKQLKIFIRKFVSKNGLKITLPAETSGDWAEMRSKLAKFADLHWSRQAELAIDELVDDFLIQHEKETFGYAFLNENEKRRIHENITRIREQINSSELTDRKKNALLEKLNMLAAEVDLHGTSTDRFFAFMGDAAFVMGDMAKKAKPFTDEVKDMLRTIGKARSRKEGTSLPPGEEVLTLPSPEAEED